MDELSVDGVISKLRRSLPPDVSIRSRKDVLRDEKKRWVVSTSIGFIFVTGVALSLVIGTAVVYMVLANDVEKQLPEYATLKAMGYTDRYLTKLVLYQACFLSLLGFLPGYVLSELLYRMTAYYANTPIAMNTGRALFVLALTIGMCATSGMLALRKAHKAEPASLF